MNSDAILSLLSDLYFQVIELQRQLGQAHARIAELEAETHAEEPS